jgi:hypothetical protein
MMKQTRIPQTDSIEELAKFWDTHDLTDFEDELEEVTEPVFARRNTTVAIDLPAQEFEALQRLAQEERVDSATLMRTWVLEKLYYAELLRRARQEFQAST